MSNSETATHVNDVARLAALRAVALLDTPTEEAFDRLSRLAVRFLKAPVALVTLVDSDRQFFKSCIGLPEPWNSRRETPLSHSFCQHNRIAGQPLLIEDARVHPLFKENMAIKDLRVIAYLGVPLVTSDRYVLGSFCVIDAKPRRWLPEEIEIIKDLAGAVMTEIQLRTEISARNYAEEQRDDYATLNEALRREIQARKQAEEQLKTLKDELEQKVEQRTQELQETQSQYLHAEKLSAIGKLSASIAHEINNPLQGILTILQSFKNRLSLEEEDKGFLELALSESYRMKNLIRSLQNFNRPSSRKKVFTDVHDSLDSVLLLCKSDFKRRRIAIVLNYAERLPQIFAVPDQIKQVFVNLLNNAADALPDGGEITISTWQEDDKVAVAVKDTGIGIEPEKIKHIFEPFYTTKPGVRGTGLGLSVSHGIVQSHHGEIRVRSRPQEGAVFTVVLPINEGREV